VEKEKLLRLATELIAQHTGQKRLVTGQPTNNWVFRTTDAEAPLLVKFIPADQKQRMETELALSNYISRQAGVPIPRILAHGTIEDQHFLLREVIPGVTLRQALNENANPKPLFIQAGETLAQFHCFNFAAKGFFNPDLSLDKSADLFNQAEYESFLAVLQAKKLLSDKEYAALRNIKMGDYYDISENVLCHCDYSLDNILVQNCRIVGILDFEYSCSAPFMDDLAAFDLFASLNGYDRYLDCFYAGYTQFRPIPDFYFSGLSFYKFYRLISMLSYQLGSIRLQGPFLEQMKLELARTKTKFCA
jgi:Ser/Thr protein kinase RdoA (MazF antagonist)